MKNLKMFAIAVMAFAVMATGVHAEVAKDCAESDVASIGTKCYANLEALTDIEAGDTIKLLGEATKSSGNLTISVDNVTIDLNGQKLDLGANSIVVEDGAKLTLTGSGDVTGSKTLIKVNAGAKVVVEGSITLTSTIGTGYAAYAGEPVIMIDGNNNAKKSTSVEVGANVTVKSVNGYGLVVNGTSSLNTTVKLDGTWTTGGYAVKVNGTVAYTENNAPKVNIVGGTFTSTKSVALYAAGYAVWDVNAKTVKGIQAVQVKSGDVTISGGSYENTEGTITEGNVDKTANGVISVVGDVANYPDAEYLDLKINGGSITAKEEGTYAVYIKDAVDSKLAINGGEFASAKNAKGKQLPVIKLDGNDGVDFLDKHEGMITNGEFTGSIIDEVSDSSHKVTAENAAAALAPNAKTENGKVIVGTGANTPSDEGQQPGSTEPGETGDGNQGPTDNVKNPETNDNILVYAGLGLVSLASVAFTARRRED